MPSARDCLAFAAVRGHCGVGMKWLAIVVLTLAMIAGCGPKSRPVVALPPPPQALPLDPQWEQFVLNNYQRVVASLVVHWQDIDFAKGPDTIRADYIADVGTVLAVGGAVQYIDSRGVLMQAGYFVRWDYPGVTNAGDTPWSLSSAGLIDKRPVPLPPETQPTTKPGSDVAQ